MLKTAACRRWCYNVASLLNKKEIIEIEEGRERVNVSFLTSRKLVFTHEGRGTRVEALPLFHLNVSPWYVKLTLKAVTDSKLFSTVYLGSPFIGVKHSMTPHQTRSWSPKLSLELSFTEDFPKVIPIGNPATAPTFVYVHSREQYIQLMLGKESGLDRLCKELNGGMHERDSVCVLSQPKGLEVMLKYLTEENGWKLQTERVSVCQSTYRTYGLVVHAVTILGKIILFFVVLTYLPAVNAWVDRFIASWTVDNEEKKIPVNEIKYYSSAYKPEQEKAIEILRERLLTAPPGSGDDTRVHNTLFSKELAWSKVRYPRPPTRYWITEEGIVVDKKPDE
eukprot:TRINITY_DN22298_c0_g1_i1.p1 TRINITY_DN22298_c0_g1~~TRINITY_DN22298_c0_g1_i1.p1  ORF type:complete len:336 (+),score=108.28 TRINITY_DN22298_c0_g1_i1:105-1112(+)